MNTLMLKHPGGWAQGVSYSLACSCLAACITRHVLWVGESCKDYTFLTSSMRVDFFSSKGKNKYTVYHKIQGRNAAGKPHQDVAMGCAFWHSLC